MWFNNTFVNKGLKKKLLDGDWSVLYNKAVDLQIL